MNMEDQATRIRTQRPKRVQLNPPPLPYVGHIELRRRADGGYLISAIGHDGQAAQFDDGRFAVEIVDRAQVERNDGLRGALERAQDALLRLRLEAALRLVAKIGRDLHDEESLVAMLRDALAAPDWD